MGIQKKTRKQPESLASLNRKDEEALAFIESYRLREGIAPTRQELASGLGLSNKMAAQRIIQKLKKHGLLQFRPQSKRSLELVDVNPTHDDIAELSVLGVVAAGQPIEAIERNDKSIKIPATMIQAAHPHFILQVSGNSMIEDSILSGDYVIIRQSQTAENGQTIVALLDDEATLKRYHREGSRVELRPANSSMKPIVVESHQHLRILGIYVGLIRMEA
jgi:repressor LexA